MIEISTEQAKRLEETIQNVYNEIVEYKNRESKILFNVENLYYQALFLKEAGEKWGYIVIKNDKIQRIQSTEEGEYLT